MRWVVLAILTLLPAAAEQRWRMQYFFDENDSSFQIRDLQFCSPTRGIAVGVLLERGNRPKGYSVVTADGGAHWTPVPLKEQAVSEFLLDDSHAWLVSEQGIWFSAEGGRDWKKLSKQKGVQRVHFLTPERGFAIGYPKLLLKTEDGGRTWMKVAVEEKTSTKPEYTEYNWISFADPHRGVIAGRSSPPRLHASRVPLWMDPEPSSRAEWPHVTVLVQTLDAGKSWESESASIFGKVIRVRTSHNRSLALLEYEDYFTYPSEIIRLDAAAGANRRVYREKSRLLTDLAFLPDGSALAAGIEPTGSISHSPVPGRVKVLQSTNLVNWTEMPVDYRASATRVTIAAVDAQHCWLATDGGMILHLEAATQPIKQ